MEKAAAEAYDAFKADPSRTVSADEAFARIRERHARRVASGE